MSSVSKNNNSFKKSKKRPSNFQRRRRRRMHARRACKKRLTKTSSSSSKVSDKLEALKNLIPANNGENVKADQLFQETADYIVLLRTQVFVLQRLVDFYGSTATTATTSTTAAPPEASNENAVIL